MKTGPVGVIVNTMNNAFQTAETILDDYKNGTLLLCDVTSFKPHPLAPSLGLLQVQEDIDLTEKLQGMSSGQ